MCALTHANKFYWFTTHNKINLFCSINCYFCDRHTHYTYTHMVHTYNNNYYYYILLKQWNILYIQLSFYVFVSIIFWTVKRWKSNNLSFCVIYYFCHIANNIHWTLNFSKLQTVIVFIKDLMPKYISSHFWVPHRMPISIPKS